MGVRTLAESIILQCLEDLSIPEHQEASVRFFAGDGFRISATLAGLSGREKRDILAMFCLPLPPRRHQAKGQRASAGVAH